MRQYCNKWIKKRKKWKNDKCRRKVNEERKNEKDDWEEILEKINKLKHNNVRKC